MNARGCRCKRSRCQKKYCECYGAGFACTANCVCTDCENGNILSPRAEDLILKPSLAKALPAHAPSTVMPARQPDYGEMRAEQLCMRQQSQQQAVAHSHYMMHQQQLQAQQQHYAHQQQVLATRGGTTSSMPAPKNTPINLYSKKRPNMYVQVPNPSQAPEGGFASTSAGQSTGHETPGMYELNRGPSGLQSATQRGSMNWGGGTPKGGYTPQGTAPSFPQFFGRQDSSLWYQDVYTSGGGICSDGSLSGLLGSPKTPRTRRQATLERAGSNDNLSSLGGLWSASGAGPSSASVRRSARVATFDGGLHRNTPPVSPIVADHFWATSADADMGLADPDNILTEPMSARAWVAHMPGPQRENSGLSQSGR